MNTRFAIWSGQLLLVALIGCGDSGNQNVGTGGVLGKGTGGSGPGSGGKVTASGGAVATPTGGARATGGTGADPALGTGGISGAAAATGGSQASAGSGGFSQDASAGSTDVSGIGGAGGASGEGGASGVSGKGGMSGKGGAGSDGGMIGGAGGGPTSGACAAMPSDRTPPYTPVYRVPLRVHTTRSDLSRKDLCGVLEEVNEIWWKQTAVCFEIEIVGNDEIAKTGMDLWFERSSPFPNGVEANGVYASPHEIYSLDEPSLNTAPNPTQYRSARTAAHEIGHGLGLNHQNCGAACNDLLMTSGRRGFALVTGSPASMDERARARTRANNYALSSTVPSVCGAPVFRDDAP